MVGMRSSEASALRLGRGRDRPTRRRSCHRRRAPPCCAGHLQVARLDDRLHRRAALRRRGVSKSLAAKTASSAHGPWRVSLTCGGHGAKQSPRTRGFFWLGRHRTGAIPTHTCFRRLPVRRGDPPPYRTFYSFMSTRWLDLSGSYFRTDPKSRCLAVNAFVRLRACSIAPKFLSWSDSSGRDAGYTPASDSSARAQWV